MKASCLAISHWQRRCFGVGHGKSLMMEQSSESFGLICSRNKSMSTSSMFRLRTSNCKENAKFRTAKRNKQILTYLLVQLDEVHQNLALYLPVLDLLRLLESLKQRLEHVHLIVDHQIRCNVLHHDVVRLRPLVRL